MAINNADTQRRMDEYLKNQGYNFAAGSRPNSQQIVQQRQQMVSTPQYQTPQPVQNNAAPSSGGGGGSSEAELAARAYQARVDAAKNSLRAIQEMIAKQIDRAKGVRDEVVGNITGRFADLRGESEQNFNTLKNRLAEEDRGVVRDYDIAGANAARTAQGDIIRNASRARALGITDSSAFGGSQARIQREGTNRQLRQDEERTSKLTGIKERVSNATGDYTRIGNEIAREEATLKSEADRNYQAQVEKAQIEERLFGINSAEALEQAAVQYQANLNGIQDYIRSQAERIGGATNAAATGISSQFAEAYDPMAKGLSGILARNSGITGLNAPMELISAGGFSPTTPTSRAITPVRRRDEDTLSRFLYA